MNNMISTGFYFVKNNDFKIESQNKEEKVKYTFYQEDIHKNFFDQRSDVEKYQKQKILVSG